LPEERHLLDVQLSHYSSLFVIRFPIVKERDKERNSRREKVSRRNTRPTIINHKKKTTTKTGTLGRFDKSEKKRDEIHLPPV
jgi:hypothetical protein